MRTDVHCVTVSVARVEDHDDLMPIFNRLTNVLSDKYGDYYLAELIESQDENMKCLVAEVNKICRAVYLLLLFVNVKNCIGLVKVVRK